MNATFVDPAPPDSPVCQYIYWQPIAPLMFEGVSYPVFYAGYEDGTARWCVYRIDGVLLITLPVRLPHHDTVEAVHFHVARLLSYAAPFKELEHHNSYNRHVSHGQYVEDETDA